jgi:hypothetical protein
MMIDWRSGPESNRHTRICSPLHHHSATGPPDAGGGIWFGTASRVKTEVNLAAMLRSAAPTPVGSVPNLNLDTPTA